MKITKEKIKKWKANSPAAFRAWLADVQPRILHRGGQYRQFKPTFEQENLIDQILASEENKFIHSMSLIIAPRRHAKTTLFCLILLWQFSSRRNWTAMLLGNSELHSRRTQFNLLIKIIQATPILNAAIPEDQIFKFEIRFPALGNVIQLSPHNVAASFGGRINCLHCADMHASPDLAPYNALQAALLDSEDSLCFIDSNVDYFDGPVHQLQREAEQDRSIFCSYTSYLDLDDYIKRAPAWLDRDKAKRLQRTTLEVDFARDILGKRLSARNSLFPEEIIQLCKSPYKVPVADISELTHGRAYKIGGGLDRSKSLFQSKSSDATIWTVVIKVASPRHGEPEFWILNQQKINPNTSRGIKKSILRDNERYHLDAVALEFYETADLSPWLSDQGISHELVSAHSTMQNSSFPEFYRIAREGRFHFSEYLKTLESEMRTFSYIQQAGGQKYSFGHCSSKFHDDTVYATNLAIYSLRSAVMNLYTLGNIQCSNRTPKRRLCYLMGGNLVLLCSRDCYCHHKVEQMFREYKSYQLDSEMTVQEFFQIKVKIKGARISQAV
jgi:hypothetical protein